MNAERPTGSLRIAPKSYSSLSVSLVTLVFGTSAPWVLMLPPRSAGGGGTGTLGLSLAGGVAGVESLGSVICTFSFVCNCSTNLVTRSDLL